MDFGPIHERASTQRALITFDQLLDAGVASVREGLIKLGYEEYVPTDLHLPDQE